MADADWQRVKELFQAALERPPEARATYLRDACRDAAVRQEVESLLASHAEAGSFIETPMGSTSRPKPGSRLGPYEILDAIGSGGMGVVYRGRDTRLNRHVAVKVLPLEMAADAGRRQRFEQEGRAASALSHPNIVAVYDVGWHEGLPFIVTELIEGEPLSERLAQGPLPVRKALECAAQVARGLAAAHDRGIVHRDLKPANLVLGPEGQVKILDFGIAKLAGPAEARVSGGATGPGTRPGLVLGTPGYMSPEQVRGDVVDARSDQFSLGCVLYELLAGRAPFLRPTAAQTMAAVLEDEPLPLAELNPRVPRPVAWLVERCLAKHPDDRYSSTRDLARDLELSLSRLSELTLPPTPARSRRSAGRAGLALAGVGLTALGGGLGLWMGQRPPAVPTVRYLTYSGRDSSPAAAPDGMTVAFSSSRDGRRRIWLKQLATGSEAPLTGGEDDHPRFSPDGSTVLFARTEAGRVSLYRVPSVGGEPRKLVDDAVYGDFSPDGRRIAFVRQFAEGAGITSVVSTAGTDGSNAEELTRIQGGRFEGGAFVHPRWSPDARHLLATESSLQLGTPTVLALIETETGQLRRLAPPSDAGVWPGGVAWVGTRNILCAQPESVVGQQTGTSSRLALLDVGTGSVRTLLSSPFNVLSIETLGPGRLVLATRWLRQNLREFPLRASGTGERWLTRGSGPTASRSTPATASGSRSAPTARGTWTSGRCHAPPAPCAASPTAQRRTPTRDSLRTEGCCGARTAAAVSRSGRPSPTAAAPARSRATVSTPRTRSPLPTEPGSCTRRPTPPRAG